MRAKPARRGARAERVKQRRPRRPLPPWLRDQRTVMLIVLGVVAAALYAVLVPVHATVYGAPVPATMLLGAGAVAAPLIALKRPTIAIVVFTASAALSPLTVARDHPLGAPWPWSVPMIIAFAVCLLAVTVPHGWRLGLILLGAGTAAGLIVALMIPSIPSANDLIVTTSISAGVYLIAVLLAGRLRLGAELSSQRALTAQEQGRRELVEERTRIARELARRGRPRHVADPGAGLHRPLPPSGSGGRAGRRVRRDRGDRAHIAGRDAADPRRAAHRGPRRPAGPGSADSATSLRWWRRPGAPVPRSR
ncbi:hypothetical protein L2X98_34100 [Microbacterium elymi]|uniref:Uncharacterized protein n=1 Tax=Microbacterium elymi TaxID=2909587 RepID=A0ABY5NJ93_9MICO|nr:hypothetical protein [Microbacterium elymi]UUT35238.1 hypothetical protein L2X98_34100 [Microbacterium elymi]